MIRKFKILARGILAPVLGHSLAKDWEHAKLKTSGYEGSSTLESLSSRVESLSKLEELPPDERLNQVVKAIRESLFDVNDLRPIRVLDIGGSFGEYFFRVKAHIPERSFDWTVLETKGHCSIIPEELSSRNDLRFISELPHEDQYFDIALLSGVIHCVEFPHEMLKKACRVANSVILNRVPLSSFSRDKVAIQRPGPFGSKGSYPVHILSELVFMEKIRPLAEISSRWMVPQDSAVIRFRYVEMQGLLLKPRHNSSV